MKKAFTLAEVLISLMIIGVIAILVLPALTQRAYERATVVKVKKIHSMLSNAYNLSRVQNGSVQDWGISSSLPKYSDIVANNLLPYLNVSKDCGRNNTTCMDWPIPVYLNNSGSPGSIGIFNPQASYQVVLQDGSFLGLRGGKCKATDFGGNSDPRCGIFQVDTNGSEGPNIFGKDVFIFELLRSSPKSRYVNAIETQEGIIPYRISDGGAVIDDDCTTTGQGTTCSDYIIKNGNMNYLH